MAPADRAARAARERPDPGSVRSAVAWMAVASFFFFAMSVTVKWAEGIPTLQIVFFRGLVALVLCLGQLWVEGVAPFGTTRGLLLARGVLGTLALLCFFWALGHLSLATATVLQQLSPVFTVLLGVVLLGERLRPVQVGLFALAACGVWLVEGAGGGGTGLGILIALGGALFAAGAYICISAIGNREHPLVIVLWFPLVTVPVVGPLLPRVWVWPSAGQWVALVATGVLVQVAQVCMTRAYQIGPVSVVSLVSYLQVAFAGIGGWLLFHEVPTARGMLGLALVVAAVLGTTRVRSQRRGIG